MHAFFLIKKVFFNIAQDNSFAFGVQKIKKEFIDSAITIRSNLTTTVAESALVHEKLSKKLFDTVRLKDVAIADLKSQLDYVKREVNLTSKNATEKDIFIQKLNQEVILLNSSNKQLNSELERINIQNQTFTELIENFKSELQTKAQFYETQFDQSQEMFKIEKSRVNEYMSMNKTLTTQLHYATEERNTMKAIMEKLEEEYEAHKLSSLQSQQTTNYKITENENLKVQLQASSLKILEFERKLSEKDFENDKMQRELQNYNIINKAGMNRINTVLDQLKTRCDMAKQFFKHNTSQNRSVHISHHSDNGAAVEQASPAQTELVIVSPQKSNINQSENWVDSFVASANNAIELVDRITELEKEKDAMATELAAVTSAKIHLEAQLKSANELNKKLYANQENLEAIERSVNELQVQQQLYSEVNSKLLQIQNEVKEKNQLLAKAYEKIKQLQNELIQTTERHAAELATLSSLPLRTQVPSPSSTIITNTALAAQPLTKKLNESIESLNTGLDQTETNISIPIDSVEVIRLKAQLANANAKLKQWMEQKTHLATTIKHLEHEISIRNNIKEQLVQLQREHKKVIHQNGELSKLLEQKQLDQISATEALKLERNQLASELHNIRLLFADKEKREHIFQDEIFTLRQTIEQLKNHTTITVTDNETIKKLESEKEKLKKQTISLTHEVATLKCICEEREYDCKQMFREKEELYSKLSEHEDRLKKFKKEILKLRTREDKHVQKQSELERTIEAEREEKQELQFRVQSIINNEKIRKSLGGSSTTSSIVGGSQ